MNKEKEFTNRLLQIIKKVDPLCKEKIVKMESKFKDVDLNSIQPTKKFQKIL